MSVRLHKCEQALGDTWNTNAEGAWFRVFALLAQAMPGAGRHTGMGHLPPSTGLQQLDLSSMSVNDGGQRLISRSRSGPVLDAATAPSAPSAAPEHQPSTEWDGRRLSTDSAWDAAAPCGEKRRPAIFGPLTSQLARRSLWKGLARQSFSRMEQVPNQVA